jgi:hypothetical protein
LPERVVHDAVDLDQRHVLLTRLPRFQLLHMVQRASQTKVQLKMRTVGRIGRNCAIAVFARSRGTPIAVFERYRSVKVCLDNDLSYRSPSRLPNIRTAAHRGGRVIPWWPGVPQNRFNGREGGRGNPCGPRSCPAPCPPRSAAAGSRHCRSRARCRCRASVRRRAR